MMVRRMIALAALLGLAGCAYRAPVMPPPGLLFTSISAPLDTDAEQTPAASKVGKAASSSVLGLFSFGDASVDSAVRDGGITTLQYLDYDYMNVLFLYQRFTTKAYGE